MVFEIREKNTNKLMGIYQNVKRARNKRDKLDNAYGSYRYSVLEV